MVLITYSDIITFSFMHLNVLIYILLLLYLTILFKTIHVRIIFLCLRVACTETLWPSL